MKCLIQFIQSFMVLFLHFLLGLILAPSVIIVEIVLKCKILWSFLIESLIKDYQDIHYLSSSRDRMNRVRQDEDDLIENFETSEEEMTDNEHDSSEVDYINREFQNCANINHIEEEINTNANENWIEKMNGLNLDDERDRDP